MCMSRPKSKRNTTNDQCCHHHHHANTIALSSLRRRRRRSALRQCVSIKCPPRRRPSSMCSHANRIRSTWKRPTRRQHPNSPANRKSTSLNIAHKRKRSMHNAPSKVGHIHHNIFRLATGCATTASQAGCKMFIAFLPFISCSAIFVMQIQCAV